MLSARGPLTHCKAASWTALPRSRRWWRRSRIPEGRWEVIKDFSHLVCIACPVIKANHLTFPSYITLLEDCWFEPPTTSPIFIQRPSLTLHWYASTFCPSLISRVCPSRFPEGISHTKQSWCKNSICIFSLSDRLVEKNIRYSYHTYDKIIVSRFSYQAHQGVPFQEGPPFWYLQGHLTWGLWWLWRVHPQRPAGPLRSPCGPQPP